MTKKEMVAVQEQSADIVEATSIITEEVIKNYFCKNATSSELALGAMICRQQGLNPFTGDVHFVKYGEQKMQVVVSKYAFLKRAENNPNYDGFKAWVESEGDDVIGKCEVYRKDRKTPIYSEVYLSEYNQGNKMWKEKPKTMIRKVAVVQAHREAFPNDLSGLLTEEEVNGTSQDNFISQVNILDVEKQINAIDTVEELEVWYINNKKIVNKDVLKVLSNRKKELLKADNNVEVIEVIEQ